MPAPNSEFYPCKSLHRKQNFVPSQKPELERWVIPCKNIFTCDTEPLLLDKLLQKGFLGFVLLPAPGPGVPNSDNLMSRNLQSRDFCIVIFMYDLLNQRFHRNDLVASPGITAGKGKGFVHFPIRRFG